MNIQNPKGLTVLGNEHMAAGGTPGEGVVREDLGKDRYTPLSLKWRTSGPAAWAQGTLLNVTCQPGREGLGEAGPMYVCG